MVRSHQEQEVHLRTLASLPGRSLRTDERRFLRIDKTRHGIKNRPPRSLEPLTRRIALMQPSTRFTTSDHYGLDTAITSIEMVEVYEFKTNSWRTLAAEVDWAVDLTCKGAAVMGNMYWIASEDEEQFILGFDFSVETFKDVCFCPLYNINNYLSCFDGDRLSFLQQDEAEPNIIEVWATNKLADVDVLFTKYFNVSRPDVPALLDHTDMAHPVYFIGEHKRIMAWSEVEVDEDDDKDPPICIIFMRLMRVG
ncbi:hypothetical protein Bca52824_085563 [Brassica carinata]|uniref:F-box associated beta-propeller type 1 domain-containing protein n=1 Tax=Brassica carinata TaxID=52824 RepID=A0A8X7P6V8_BRACI|nr:hypothetical protein Bca52824_085563 [Brassica carinata]